MRIKHSQIEPLAHHIIKSLNNKKLAVFVKQPDLLAELVVHILKNNFEEEEKLNEEAKKLLDQNKKKIGLTIDDDRAFSMIKKQLAKDRNFVL